VNLKKRTNALRSKVVELLILLLWKRWRITEECLKNSKDSRRNISKNSRANKPRI
jgi:hypothetical protein